MQSFANYSEITEGKITMFAHFYEYHWKKKKNEKLYDFEGPVKRLKTFEWILNLV